MKIDSLTENQKSLLIDYRDKWLKIGLSIERADHAKAEDALRRAYKIAGLAPPKQIIWVGSPLSGSIVASILKNDEIMKKVYAAYEKDLKKKIKRKKPGASVRASVWANVSASVGDSVWNSVGASVWASVSASVKASVWDSVRDSVWNGVGASVWASVSASVKASVKASVWASVGDSVWDSVIASVGDSVWDAIYGQHDAHWLGFYNYFLEVMKLESCEKLIPLMDLAQHSNWIYPYKNIAIMSEKPIACHLQGIRLHKEDGPAVAYPDGFSIWALNGVRVPQWVSESKPEDMKVSDVMGLTNVEQRRVAMQRAGLQKFLDRKLLLDKEGDYELYHMEISGTRVGPYLKMSCPSTGRVYVEGVGDPQKYENIDPTIKTCREALDWRIQKASSDLVTKIFKKPEVFA